MSAPARDNDQQPEWQAAMSLAPEAAYFEDQDPALFGTALAAAAGALVAGSSVPFQLSPATMLTPAAIMITLGVLGAALSIRRITSVDPLTAPGVVADLLRSAVRRPAVR